MKREVRLNIHSTVAFSTGTVSQSDELDILLTLVNRRMEKRYSDLTTYMLLSPSDGASVARREPASQRPVNNSRNQPAQKTAIRAPHDD